jgi:hypothetical protein
LLIDLYTTCKDVHSSLDKKADSEDKIYLPKLYLALGEVEKHLFNLDIKMDELISANKMLDEIRESLKKIMIAKKTKRDLPKQTPSMHGLFHESSKERQPETQHAPKKVAVKKQKDIEQITMEITKSIGDLITKIIGESLALSQLNSETFMRYASEAEEIMSNSAANPEERIVNTIAVLTELVHSNQNAKPFSEDLKHITKMCEDIGIKITMHKTSASPGNPRQKS